MFSISTIALAIYCVLIWVVISLLYAKRYFVNAFLQGRREDHIIRFIEKTDLKTETSKFNVFMQWFAILWFVLAAFYYGWNGNIVSSFTSLMASYVLYIHYETMQNYINYVKDNEEENYAV